MKKPILFIASILILTSCEKKKEDCYDFYLTTTVSRDPDNSDYPIVSKSVFTQCGITYDESKIVAESYKSYDEYQDQSGGTIITTRVCTQQKH